MGLSPMAIVVAMVVTLGVGPHVLVVGAEMQGEAEMGGRHHVVGGDRGWDVASDVPSWAVHRVFIVGDNIWFTYSVAKEGLAEVRSQEEFESCDLRNPIRMYTDGLNKVTLDGEGPRYFTSSNILSCKDGLKLQLNVLPRAEEQQKKTDFSMALAAGPSPSGLGHATVPSLLWMIGLALVYLYGLERI